MIVTVTLNPAWDVTYETEQLVPGTTNRITVAGAHAGGKGINVARVLTAQGVAALAVAPVGGPAGDLVADDLARSGVPNDLVPIAGATHATVTVHASDGTGATVFAEPGPTVRAAEWQAIVATVARNLPDASVLVCSGSLPPGIGPSGPAQLVRLAAFASCPAVIDLAGPALLLAAEAGAAVVKPNLEEATEALRSRPGYLGSGGAVTAARALCAAGAGAAVVSMGADGLVAVGGSESWSVRPPFPVSGNLTGAGDALAAALAYGIEMAMSWPDRRALAIAWASAAVAAPVAGSLDPAVLVRATKQTTETLLWQ